MSDWLREVEHAGYSVQYSGPDSEQNPLLPAHTAGRTGRCVRIFWIIFLTILFCSGLLIGCYLIIEEDQEYPVTDPFTLYDKSGWRAESPITQLTTFKSIPSRVVIIETSTNNCDNVNDCSKIIYDIQKNHMTVKNLSDIAYNFIVAGDGATYEGRGWKYQPHLLDAVDNRTLVIAFLGDFQNDVPTSSQITECKVLFRESVNLGYLDPCFTLSLFKNRPQDGGGQLVHIYNKLVMENNKRKFNLHCL